MGSTLLTLFLFGPLLDSWWWILDDHRWADLTAFGTTQVAPAEVLPHAKLSFDRFLTEAFQPPDWPLGGAVNRPTWFAVNSTWAFIFGDDVRLWYLARVLCFLFAAAAFWYAAAGLLGTLLAGLLTASIAVQPFWIDIVPRAQSETFAAWGSAVYLLGVSLLLKDGEFRWRDQVSSAREWTAALCIVAGGLTAIGSKENFTALLFVSTLCLLIVCLYTKRPVLISRSFAVVLVGAGVLLYYIYKGVVVPGKDLYGNTVQGRLAVLFRPSMPELMLFLCCVCFAAVGMVWFQRFRTSKAPLIPLLVAAALQCYLIASVLFLKIFYGGNLPHATRYEFPSAVLPYLSGAVLIALLLQKELWSAWYSRARKAILNIAVYGTVAVLLATNITANRKASLQYTKSTRTFRDRIQAVASELKKTPATPLVFESYATYNAEFLSSVAKQLRVAGVGNPFYCKITGYPNEKAQTSIDRLLISIVTAQIGEGRRFLPASHVPPGVEPKVITFSAPAPKPPGVLASFWPLP